VEDATDKWGHGVSEIEGGTWLSVTEREERGELPRGLLCLGQPAAKPREKRESFPFIFFCYFKSLSKAFEIILNFGSKPLIATNQMHQHVKKQVAKPYDKF
jgi:hypothetical protein